MLLAFVIFVKIVCLLFFDVAAINFQGFTSDQTSSRPNTLIDDADDIQRQLDNEARDRFKYGRPKTIWAYHLLEEFPQGQTMPYQKFPHLLNKPSKISRTSKKQQTSTPKFKQWDYNNQNEWLMQYPSCGGNSQSPVDLPASGLVKTRGCRHLNYINYDIVPWSLTLFNDGRKYSLYGQWDKDQQPVVYGGAAHSRRYIFYSLTLHWPSEHRIGGIQYPFETQVLHISAEYETLQKAIEASPSDRQAFLGIVNLYKFGNHTQYGIQEILRSAVKLKSLNTSVPVNALHYFNPPMKEYACYQGSLTTPPCSESVLWLIRGKSLPITRESLELAYSLMDEGELRGARTRQPHPLNDRKVYFIRQ